MVRTLYLERESREGNGGASRPGTSVSVKPFPEVKLDYLLAVDIPLPWTDHHEEVSTAGKGGGREELLLKQSACPYSLPNKLRFTGGKKVVGSTAILETRAVLRT